MYILIDVYFYVLLHLSNIFNQL